VSNDNQIAVAQEFFDNAFHGKIPEAVEHVDPDATYHVPGANPMAGEFKGPEAIAGHVGDLLRITKNRVDVIQWEDWLEGFNHLGALVHMRMQRDGSVVDIRSIYLLTMSEEEKIRRIEVFFSDQAAVDRFLADR